jgi:hypothetical protein
LFDQYAPSNDRLNRLRRKFNRQRWKFQSQWALRKSALLHTRGPDFFCCVGDPVAKALEEESSMLLGGLT